MEDDLDTLLDDALADFDKPVASISRNDCLAESQQQQPPTSYDSTFLQPPVNVFQEFFDGDMSEKLQVEWNAAMKELHEEDPDLADQIKMMSQNLNEPSTSNVPQSSNTTQPSEFDTKVKEALESMAKSSLNDVPPDDIMKNMFDLNLDDTDGSEGDFPGLGMMEDMMKMMLSKEMLYPPMNELRKNFPEWLEKNKDLISENEKKNYENQLGCLNIICKEFESEKDSDSDTTKKNRFDAVMNAVNKMQQYGQPPASLLEDYDVSSLPQEPCCIS